jgi:hypothetical protein
MSSIMRDPKLGLVWLAVRLWVGSELLDAGWAGGTAPIDRVFSHFEDS